MSNQMKCKSCGSTDIDVDPSRADAVCTNCGNVLESSIIVSDIQFEENAHGGASAIGTFVPGDAKGKTRIFIILKSRFSFLKYTYLIFFRNQAAVCLTLEEAGEA